jgi:hypothetical protein
MCLSIKGDGHTEITATSRTANPASPLRMNWTNNSRSATGKEWDGVMKTPATPEAAMRTFWL